MSLLRGFSTAAALAAALCPAAAWCAPAPVISSFLPQSGSIGTVVTLIGSGFTGCSSAQSGLNRYSTSGYVDTVRDGVLTVISDTKATYTIPPDGASGQIFVGNGTVQGWAPGPITVVATTVPPVPPGLTAMASNGNVQLAWTGTIKATAYSVRRSTASGGPYTVVGSPTLSSYVDRAVANNTTYFYVVAATDAIGSSPNSPEVSALPAALPPGSATITVTPSNTHAISPYIYGINFAANVAGAPPALTLDRAGGNRWSAYNWETNASNAGSDYLYENDKFLSDSSTPAEAVASFILGDQKRSMSSLITFQMLGLVAGDSRGPVGVISPPDLTRFKKVIFQKKTVSGAPFTRSPPTGDAYVFMDEFIWALDQKFAGQNVFGATPSTRHVFAELDNEPEIWNRTHLEILGSNVIAPDAYIGATVALAKALKTQFPDLVIFGPAHYGFYGIYAWNGKLSPTATANNWFTDKYLLAIKEASVSFGRPLVDVYDFHWYPEATDAKGNRTSDMNDPILSDDQVQSIVQSPRSLWDKTYTERSWIAKNLDGPIYLLGRLQAKIAAENPGMKLAITEYNHGGSQHIAGTIAQADSLGIFGTESVFAATLWPLKSTESHLLAGFRAFRDFDGAGHHFGDISVQASSSNIANVATYVSTDSSRPGRVVMVAINRSMADQVTTIAGQPLSGTAHLFRITAASAATQTTVAPVAAGSQAVAGSGITLTLPALSVTTLDIY
jgi:hypothetical protein